MGELKKNGEKTTPDFTEEDFISAIETALNRSLYYSNKFIEIRRISQAKETELGYDGILNTIIPFYIQFKRSDFYSPQFKGQLINDRKKIQIPVEKGFFAFELLRKNNKFEQHNAMFLLSRHNKAAYVAPKFFKSRDLSILKSLEREILPIHYGEILLYNTKNKLIDSLNNLTLFKQSITITPHALIKDKSPSHHYSYCKNNKVAFHSEPIEIKNSNSQNLYYFIRDILDLSGDNSQNIINSNYNLLPTLFGIEGNSFEFSSIIEATIKRISFIDSDTNIESITKQLDTIDKLLILEDILYNYFNIRQFIMFKSNLL